MGRDDSRRKGMTRIPPERPDRPRRGGLRCGPPLRNVSGWASGERGSGACRYGCAGRAGRTVRLPCDGGHGPPEAAARNRCRSRAAWASGQGWRRRSWGGWSNEASNAAARQRVRRAKPAAARPTAFSTVLRPARAAMTCRPRAWDGQRVAPFFPPAGAEVVPAGTADRGEWAERRVGGHGPDCGGSP